MLWPERLIVGLMPARVQDALAALPDERWLTLEEVRVRADRPVGLYGHDWYMWLGPEGVVRDPQGGLTVSRLELELMVEMMAARSLHGHAEELAQGYLTVTGGHRAGVAGRAVVVRGEVTTTRDWVGVNLRIARAVEGAAGAVLAALGGKRLATFPPPSILLLSPPRGGKTTVLRDLVGAFSRRGLRVGVVDERREIGNGGPPVGFDLGPHTDLLDGWPKAPGVEAAVRSLGLDLVAVDEIGSREDGRAVRLARRSGVAVLATAHARDVEAARRHPLLQAAFVDRVFDFAAELQRGRTPGELRKLVALT
jgi:stage III sporulation protein AA